MRDEYRDGGIDDSRGAPGRATRCEIMGPPPVSAPVAVTAPAMVTAPAAATAAGTATAPRSPSSGAPEPTRVTARLAIGIVGAGAVLVAAGLIGCGGGGSTTAVGSNPATPVAAPMPAPSPPPGASPSPSPPSASAPAPSPSPTPGPTPPPGATPPTPAPGAGTPRLPRDDEAGIVRWGAHQTPADIDLTLEIEVFATVPPDADGRAQRLNTMAHAKGRLYVGSELGGQIYRLEPGSMATPWFDVAAALRAQGRRLDVTPNWESGLRSIAFHPAFDRNGRFYISALVERPADRAGLVYLSDATPAIGVDSLVMEWTADPATMAVDPASFREVFRVGLPRYDHPVKQIAFGPDGLLYIGHGDGSDPAATDGGGQPLAHARGKILRIDPVATATAPFSVPPDNPFVATPGAVPAIFSLGHRNPHHLAFLADGRPIVAEPGHDNLDEINLIESGGNYGWSLREGSYVHRASGGIGDGIAALPIDDAANGFVYPAIELGHAGPRGSGSKGVALGGGYVVDNGSPLSGRYFYCEFATWGDLYAAGVDGLKATVRRGDPAALTAAPVERVRLVLDSDGDPATPVVAQPSMLAIVASAPDYEGGGRADIRFGQGPDGTLYLMSKQTGTVYRVRNSRPPG